MIFLVLGALGAFVVLAVLLSRSPLGCIVLNCLPEVMACNDPQSQRIRKQAEALKHLEVPGDVNIAIAAFWMNTLHRNWRPFPKAAFNAAPGSRRRPGDEAC